MSGCRAKSRTSAVSRRDTNTSASRTKPHRSHAFSSAAPVPVQPPYATGSRSRYPATFRCTNRADNTKSSSAACNRAEPANSRHASAPCRKNFAPRDFSTKSAKDRCHPIPCVSEWSPLRPERPSAIFFTFCSGAHRISPSSSRLSACRDAGPRWKSHRRSNSCPIRLAADFPRSTSLS